MAEPDSESISAILVGIGAAIVADQTKLTATKLLVGGFYIEDQYREVLYAGIALAIGLDVVGWSGADSSEPAL